MKGKPPGDLLAPVPGPLGGMCWRSCFCLRMFLLVWFCILCRRLRSRGVTLPSALACASACATPFCWRSMRRASRGVSWPLALPCSMRCSWRAWRWSTPGVAPEAAGPAPWARAAAEQRASKLAENAVRSFMWVPVGSGCGVDGRAVPLQRWARGVGRPWRREAPVKNCEWVSQRGGRPSETGLEPTIAPFPAQPRPR